MFIWDHDLHAIVYVSDRIVAPYDIIIKIMLSIFSMDPK